MKVRDKRVRIAPSPSGSSGLHLGNAKTALFNYLFAQKYDADFILRIEDTDQARVVEGCADYIIDNLKWLGIMPNMGFGTNNQPAVIYTQMRRLASYQKIAHQLVEQGLAYKCYCTEEELDRQRQAALEKNPKNPFKYPGTCRNLTQENNKPYIIRFKAPTEGSLEYEDIAFGKRLVPNKENWDFVLLRANGFPLYNFACVIDDGITDRITHVIRGSDHLKNLPQQILLYQALKLPLPVFCHLPMLLNANGAKLSKRDGSVSVEDYRKNGYTPSGILNYLVRFGWGWKDQEIFSLNEMIEKFTLEDCNCRDGKFDPKKFLATQYQHLKSQELTSDATYLSMLEPFLTARGFTGSPNVWRQMQSLALVRSRSHTLVEAAEEMEPFLVDYPTTPNTTSETFKPELKTQMAALLDQLKTTSEENWQELQLREDVKTWLTTKQLTLKEVGGFLRLALTGRSHSPELFQVMGALGRVRSLQRLERGLKTHFA